MSLVLRSCQRFSQGYEDYPLQFYKPFFLYIFASLELLGMGGQGLHIASGAPKEFLLEKLSVQRKTYHKN